jgi:MarR family transcriptional regulator, lower aerobic nicotinate degradation pathway regulator
VSTLRRVAGRPTWLLSRANARAHGLLVDAFAAENVRGYHFRVLAALDQYGALSQADLGRSTGIDRSDVVATLNDLAERGLTRRAPDPQDRRRNIVTITTRGSATLDRLDVVFDEIQESVLAPLTANERKTFLRLLSKLT